MKPLDISPAAFLAPLVFSEKAGTSCGLEEAFGSALPRHNAPSQSAARDLDYFTGRKCLSLFIFAPSGYLRMLPIIQVTLVT